MADSSESEQTKRHEEKLLLAHFGEPYAQYMREVPMWVPRPSKR